jgi:hypothetical protein
MNHRRDLQASNHHASLIDDAFDRVRLDLQPMFGRHFPNSVHDLNPHEQPIVCNREICTFDHAR